MRIVRLNFFIIHIIIIDLESFCSLLLRDSYEFDTSLANNQ